MDWFESLAAEGQVIPALEERPTAEGVEWIWSAYVDLGTCRAIGMDIGPIPWTAAREYAQAHDLSPGEFELLWECISRMESVYRDWLQKRKPKTQAHVNDRRRNSH